MATNKPQPPHPLAFRFPGDAHIAQFDQSLQNLFESLSALIGGGSLDWPSFATTEDVAYRVYLDDLLSEIIGIGGDTWYDEQIAEFDEILTGV